MAKLEQRPGGIAIIDNRDNEVAFFASSPGGDTAGSAAIAPLAFNTQSASYTLVLGDYASVVGINNASPVNLTVPPNASVPFPVGTEITIRQVGAGQVTIVAGGGVTINARGNAFKLVGQWSYATLVKTATDTWDLMGDIVP